MFGICLADYHMLSSADVCFFVFELNQRLGWNTNIPTNKPLFYNDITLHCHVQDFNFLRKRPYYLCFLSFVVDKTWKQFLILYLFFSIKLYSLNLFFFEKFRLICISPYTQTIINLLSPVYFNKIHIKTTLIVQSS